jgi:hypothetical protein
MDLDNFDPKRIRKYWIRLQPIQERMQLSIQLHKPHWVVHIHSFNGYITCSEDFHMRIHELKNLCSHRGEWRTPIILGCCHAVNKWGKTSLIKTERRCPVSWQLVTGSKYINGLWHGGNVLQFKIEDHFASKCVVNNSMNWIELESLGIR